MAATWDAIVIGGGHNGLVAGAYLARAGARTVVLEARDKVGGAAATDAPWPEAPDIKVTRLSYVMSLMPPGIIGDLGLERHGYKLFPMGPAYQAWPDGRSLTIWDDDARRNHDQISKFSKRDADAMPRWDAWLEGLAAVLGPLLTRTPPKIGSRRPSDLRDLLRLAWRYRGLDVRTVGDVTRLMTMSASDLLDDWFESEQVKASLAINGVIGTWAGPDSPGTAYVMAHHSIGDVGDGHLGSWGFPEGGMGALADAIHRSALANGASVRTGARVERVLVDGGRATGVVLHGGEELHAPVVVTAVHPRTTFLEQVERAELPADFVADIERWRSRSGVVKINLALGELPDFTADPGTEVGEHHTGAIAMALSVGYIERAFQDAKQGRGATRPFSDGCIPTVFDKTLAPEGIHVMSLFTQWCPHEWSEAPHAEELEAYADRMIDCYAELAPNLKGAILHREVIGPWQMEQEWGLVGGNIFHGELSVEQLFHMRPAPGYADYRSPIAGLYQASSATNGGGGSAASRAGRPSAPSRPTAGGPSASGEPGPPARAAVGGGGRGQRPGRVVRGPAGRPAARRRLPGDGPAGQPPLPRGGRPPLPSVARGAARAGRPGRAGRSQRRPRGPAPGRRRRDPGGGDLRQLRRRRARPVGGADSAPPDPPEPCRSAGGTAGGDRPGGRDGGVRRQRHGLLQPRAELEGLWVPRAARPGPRPGRRSSATPGRCSRPCSTTTAGSASTWSCRPATSSSPAPPPTSTTPWSCRAPGWWRCSSRRSGSRRRSGPRWPRRPPGPSRWSPSRSAAARRPGPWLRPTRAPWPAPTAPTRPCSTPTGWPGWPASTSWPTPASCRRPGAGPPPAGWPPSTTPAASGPTCWTWPSGCGCRWPRSRPRPGSGWRPCWSPACRPPTRWMPGGTGNDANQIFASCIRALLEDPDAAALALNLDLTTEPTPDASYTGLAVDAAASTSKPVAVIANLASAVDPAEAAILRAAGVPVLEGTTTGLAAFGHLFAHRNLLAEGGCGQPCAPGTRVGPGAVVGRLGDPGRALDEAEGLALLGDWGIPVVAAEVAGDLEEALAAAGRIGWPVALKTATPQIAHKSDVGGVRLGLDGPDRLAAAYAGLAARLGPRVLVAAMAAPGVELALGVVADPQFGPLVMVAAGGLLVEVMGDRRFALPPVGHRQALAMLDRLALRPLLDGTRGAPPADLDAVAGAIVRLSALAVDLGGRPAALDVNPLVAGPGGCLAVDALVVAAPAGP